MGCRFTPKWGADFGRNLHWSQVLDIIAEGKWDLMHKNQEKNLRTLLDEKADQVLAKIVLLLAQSNLLPSAEVSQLKRVSDFLKRNFIQDSTSWIRHTTPDVAGAAIERSGKLIDALQFYENDMFAPVFTPEQKSGHKYAGSNANTDKQNMKHVR
jgi:hypothetical protein